MNPSARLTFGRLAGESQALEIATDESLARRGDAASFAELYERHLPAVYRYVVGRVRSREEAEDLTSDVFRHVWLSRTRYGGHGTFRAWLFSIVRRTVADHYRRHQPVERLEPAIAERVLDQAPTPEDQVVQDERQRHLRHLLDGLSQEQQEILGLRFAAELSYAEIAVVIGKREEAVKKIAYRTLEVLRGRSIHA